MNTDEKDNVRSLPQEKYTALSEENGWSLEFAKGYVNGEMERRRGNPLSTYVRVGLDQYALGFRAGYFTRQDRYAGERSAKDTPKIQQAYGVRVSVRNPVLAGASEIAGDLAHS